MENLTAEFGNPRNETFRSLHFSQTLVEVAQKAPELSEDVKSILESTDAQGILNLRTFEPEEFPGLQIPFTKVNVNTVFGRTFHSATQEADGQQTVKDSKRIAYSERENHGIHPEDEANLERRSDNHELKSMVIYFIFRGFANPPRGHPFTAWNMVYDRVITEFPKIANALKNKGPIPDIDVYSLGSPVGLGGKVSKSFIDSVSADGFEAHGKAYADLVASVLPQDSKVRIIFNGNSLGSTIAAETAKKMPEINAGLLLDNPVNVENRHQAVRYLTGIQQAIMYAVEVGAKRILNKEGAREAREEQEFNTALAKIFMEKGIPADDSEQLKLKKNLILLDEKNVIKGNPLDPNIRTLVRRGKQDLMTTTPKDYLTGKNGAEDRLTSYGQRGRISNFVIDSTHFIKRIRVKRWKQAIEFSKGVKESLF